MNADELFEKEKKIFESINDYEIEIGVISSTDKRKSKFNVGLTNAELMFIHENGSPLRNIPARPVLEMTLQYTQSTLLQQTVDSCVEGVFELGWVKSDIEKELEKLCIRMENYAREIIYSNDGRLVPNSREVARRKKGNHPLFDTGQLARSIVCKLVKKD